MKKMKKQWMCLILTLVFMLGLGITTEAATSYSMKNGKSVTVTNKNTDGKGKKYYFTFKVEKRSYVQILINQVYYDYDVDGLKAKDLADTKFVLQVKKNGKWKKVGQTDVISSEYNSLDDLEDEDGNPLYPGKSLMAEGTGFSEACLEKGTYRFVVKTAYPEAKLSLKIKKYKKPALTKGKATALKNADDKAYGIFTSKDTKAQWYSFKVSKKGKVRVGTEYLATSENKTILTTYLYNKSGKLIWKGRGVTNAMKKDKSGYYAGGVDQWLTLKKGTYYVKIVPTSLDKSGKGSEYTFYTYPLTSE